MSLWEPGDPNVEPRAATTAEIPETARTWGVGELGLAIEDLLDEHFPNEVWVRGQIRNLKPPNGKGHRYFELVEADHEPGARPTASLSVALFKRARDRVNATLRDAGGGTCMSDGIEIRVRARLDWWLASGQLRLVMSDIDPVFTLGQLEVERARLLARLTSEGLLRRNAERVLVPTPLRVGLVTSRGSAAHADTLHELERSGFAFTVVTADARVQGLDAPRSIEAALERLVRYEVDVVLLVRGGGARTDLVAFDSEQVARAIAACPVPVFCGIGHEIDHTVADDVAHTSAKTPTACAAELVDHVRRADDAVEQLWRRIEQRSTRQLQIARAQLQSTALRAERSVGLGLRGARQRQRAVAARVGRASAVTTSRATQRLDDRQARLATVPLRSIARADERLDGLDQHRRLVDPARLLARGWSITHTVDGTTVRDPDDAPAGTVLRTTLATGTLISRSEGALRSPDTEPETP